VIAIGALARYDRPAPSLTDYDQLLTTQPITRSACFCHWLSCIGSPGGNVWCRHR